MRKFILTIAAVATSATGVLAQDFHLSSYDGADLYYNPASTGMFKGRESGYRVFSAYRTQWMPIGLKPFTTFFVSYDAPGKAFSEKWGFGGYFLSNSSAQGQFKTYQSAFSSAYNIISGSDKHYLTAGIQLGILYRTLGVGDFTYDLQYNNSTGNFDQSLSSQESNPIVSITKFDAALGVSYRYFQENSKWKPYGSFSAYHITKPNESFTGNKLRIPIRFNLIGGTDIDISDKFTLSPRMLYANQAKAYEFNIGILSYYKVNSSSIHAMIGADYRYKDAIVAHVGIKQKNNIFRFSYDVNISGLNSYTSGRGAWEFSVIIRGSKGNPVVQPILE
jgi:type IX secretion system PorP/SprF family membrane protein